MSHSCPTIVLQCIDFRFWGKLIDHLKNGGVDKFDHISLAGGAKNLVDEDTRAIVFKQLDICTQKHDGETIYLVSHIDCGAYGGSAAFESIEKERERLIADLRGAKTIIEEKYPQLEIKLLLNTWEGVEKI